VMQLQPSQHMWRREKLPPSMIKPLASRVNMRTYALTARPLEQTR